MTPVGAPIDAPPAIVDKDDEFVSLSDVDEIPEEPSSFYDPLTTLPPLHASPRGGCMSCFSSGGRRRASSADILCADTGFTRKEVHALHERFSKIAPKGFMTREQFKQTLGMLAMTPSDYIPCRIFSVFDSDHDGVLHFGEYLRSFAVFLRGTEEDRMALSFKLADASESGRLHYADFRALLRACQTTTSALLENQTPISESEMESIFREVSGGASEISLEQYSEGIRENPRFLEIIGLRPKVAAAAEQRPEACVVGGSGRLRGESIGGEAEKAEKKLETMKEALDKLRSDLLAHVGLTEGEIANRLSDILTGSLEGGPFTPYRTPRSPKQRASDDGSSESPSPPASPESPSIPMSPVSDLLMVPPTRQAKSVQPGTFSGAVSPEIASEGSRPPSPPFISVGPRPVTPASGGGRSKGHRLLGPKRGMAVHFGHENWNMVLSMMIGIRLAVGRASFEIDRPVSAVDFVVKDKFSIVPQLSNFLDSKISAKVKVTRFIDYAPLVFRKLREEVSGISEEEYTRSVGPEQLLGNMVLGNLSSLAELTSEGKGGAFFYYTADGRFMIKTVTRDEKRLLKQILHEYYHHLNENRNSHVVRFYGLHGLRLKRDPILFQRGKYRNDEKIFFVVMGNLFNTPLEVHRRYDLKGSWVGRRTGTDADSNVALKDLDLIERGEVVNVGPEKRNAILQQLRKDIDFFAKHNIIDYSLLLGIHDRRVGSGGTDAVSDKRIGECTSLDGSCVYYIGIIDILCQYDTRKRLENFFKSIRYASKGISAVPAQEYADRFFNFIADHVV